MWPREAMAERRWGLPPSHPRGPPGSQRPGPSPSLPAQAAPGVSTAPLSPSSASAEAVASLPSLVGAYLGSSKPARWLAGPVTPSAERACHPPASWHHRDPQLRKWLWKRKRIF